MFNHPLVRDVAVILVVKTAIVVAAALFVFGPQRLQVTANSIAAHLLHSGTEATQ